MKMSRFAKVASTLNLRRDSYTEDLQPSLPCRGVVFWRNIFYKEKLQIRGNNMGEAKRRQETDPNYGKKAKAPSKSESKKKEPMFSLKKVSKTEWIIWAVLFTVATVSFILTRST